MSLILGDASSRWRAGVGAWALFVLRTISGVSALGGPDIWQEETPLRTLRSGMSFEEKVAFRSNYSTEYHDSIIAAWQKGRLVDMAPNRHVFDPFESEWNCPTREPIPYRWGDGHKFMCGIQHTRPADCLIYSVGCNAEDSWERAMARARPECAIHIFDPTLGATGSRRMQERAKAYGARFHPIGLSYRNESAVSDVDSLNGLSEHRDYRTPRSLTLASLMGSLGHAGRRIDFLKIDIEGGEWK
eukprot:5747790-Prymnesium_polylepis.1